MFLQNKSEAFRLASLVLPLSVFLLISFHYIVSTNLFSRFCLFIPRKASTPSVPCIGNGRSLKINPTIDCVFYIDFGSMFGQDSEPLVECAKRLNILDDLRMLKTINS